MKFECEKCGYATDNKKHYETHCDTVKHKNNINKVASEYEIQKLVGKREKEENLKRESDAEKQCVKCKLICKSGRYNYHVNQSTICKERVDYANKLENILEQLFEVDEDMTAEALLVKFSRATTIAKFAKNFKDEYEINPAPYKPRNNGKKKAMKPKKIGSPYR